MNRVQVSHIAKSFGNVQAVRDVSFEVEKGEIFGLLAPKPLLKSAREAV